jgi:hypothetical protein
MKTRDLVSLLATDVAPVGPHTMGKRLGWVLLVGLLRATCPLVGLYGVRSDMPQMLTTPLFWLKVAFPITIVAAALLAATGLSRPGASTKVAWMALAVPLLATWFATALIIFAAPPALRLGLILGTTWRVWAFNIVLLSVPTFAAVFWAMRGLAPTRLPLAGAGAGLLADAQAVLA